MKKKNLFFAPAALFALFVIYTLALMNLDVQPIGPRGSSVGFATLNGVVHRLLGVHMGLYTLTDWLGIVALPFMFGFALLGLVQLIRRKSLLRVDGSILALGGFYGIVLAAYLFFEVFVVNNRPVLIEGCLEASYPSSTTMLMLCVMPTAMMQFRQRIQNRIAQQAINTVLGIFTVAMVVGRLVSGVHWFTDILGGALLSAALVTLYYAVADCAMGRQQKK